MIYLFLCTLSFACIALDAMEKPTDASSESVLHELIVDHLKSRPQDPCGLLGYLKMLSTRYDISTAAQIFQTCLEEAPVSIDQIKNKHNMTLLHWTAFLGCTKIAECLLQAVPENKIEEFISIKDDTEKTALHYAAFHGQAEIATLLISVNYTNPYGFVSIINEQGETALHIAATQGYANIAALLIMVCNKSSINLLCIQDKNGDTALHKATLRRYIEIIKQMLVYINPKEAQYLMNLRNNDVSVQFLGGKRAQDYADEDVLQLFKTTT